MTHCSENCTQVLGVEPAELIGHSIRELMADDQVDQVLDGAVRARRQMEMRATTMPTAEGNPAPSRSQVVPGKEGAADEEEKSAPDEVDAWISAFEEDRLPNAMISGPYYTMIVTIRDKTHCLCAHIPKQADRSAEHTHRHGRPAALGWPIDLSNPSSSRAASTVGVSSSSFCRTDRRPSR